MSEDSSWMYLIMSENGRILNTNLILLRVVLLRSQLVLYERSAKKSLYCFCKTLYCWSLAKWWICIRYAIYQSWEYRSASKYARVLYIPRFWICWDSQYTKALNISGLWIYHSSEYAWVPNILGLYRPFNVSEYLWINPEYSWLCLIMPRMLNTSLTLFLGSD